MWKLFLSRLWLPVAFIALVAACSDGEPAPLTEPPARASEAAVQPDDSERASARAEDLESAEDPAEQVSEEDSGTAETEAVTEADAQESASRSTEVAAGSTVAEREDEEEPAEGLTDVPGIVLADVDVRVRPGLAWPTVDQLEVGASVVVMHGAGGWYRVWYGGELKGWIRSNAVDLGGIDEWSVLRQPPPAILAEWRGVEYGVMGQSADGVEVRLLAVDDEQSEVLAAPKDEVRLLAEDIALDDLPILIGDETVVFPGDDFRAGQGKILPRADEWMWLPWGWLLAHNDEYIWQWRPETDELEFIRRPAGPAKLSPNGRHLAIVTLCAEDAADCRGAAELTLLPLDGSRPSSLRTAVASATEVPQIEILLSDSPNDLHWSAMGDALMVYVVPAEWTNWWYPVVLLGAGGSVTYLSPYQLGQHLGEACYLSEITDDHGDAWWTRPDNTIAAVAGCESDEGGYTYVDIVFGLSGEFLHTEPSRYQQLRDAGADRIRSSEDGGRLGEDVEIHWSTTSRFALVVDRDSATLSVYDAAADRIRPITDSSSNLLSVADWTTGSQVDSLAYRRSFTWNVFWDEDRMAAVMPRVGNDWILGGLLLDPSTAEGAPFYYGWQSTWLWPCLRTGVWNPEGTLFHVMVRSPAGAGIGITAKDIGVFQSLVIGLSGEVEAALISARTYWYVGAPTRSEWSPDGDWFAVGGQQGPSECHFHP